MKSIYSIGKFQFDSYTEYKKGLADVKKIKYISDEVDVNEPGVALRLYTLVRQNDIRFQTKIGEDYLLYLSDLIANDYKESVGDEPYLAGLQKTKSPRRLVGIICVLAAIACFGYFIGDELNEYRKSRELLELQERRKTSQTEEYISNTANGTSSREEDAVPEPPAPQEPVERTILPEYAELQQQNQEMIGWITIPDTNIDQPVLQTTDNKYYLEHNFSKEEDSNGSIFLDARNDLDRGDKNLILYGHNMRSGLMFGGLKEYQDEKYLQEHPQIQFNTLYEKRKYDIIAVCLADVRYQDEEGFRYYNYLGASTPEEFESFKANIARMNILDRELDITYEDELITLSTCNNYIEDGRLFLIAKRVE